MSDNKLPTYAELLGRAIAAVRAEKGLSRQDLVRAGACSYAHLAKIEDGSTWAAMDVIGNIAAQFGMRTSQLLARAEQLGPWEPVRW
jgi:transcriptional regulator with XRE-family HTH domain